MVAIVAAALRVCVALSAAVTAELVRVQTVASVIVAAALRTPDVCSASDAVADRVSTPLRATVTGVAVRVPPVPESAAVAAAERVAVACSAMVADAVRTA